jgi:hypothetical protein
VEDDAHTHAAVNTLNVEVWDGNSSYAVGASACVLFYGADGGACGSQATSTGTGHRTLAPAKTYWSSTYASAFAYVFGVLPQTNGGAKSQLEGIYYSSS